MLTVFQADASEVARAFASFADNKRAKIGLDVFALLFATTSTLTWTRGLCPAIYFQVHKASNEHNYSRFIHTDYPDHRLEGFYRQVP